ncbi:MULTISPECIES: hypothetical protein [Bacillus cereus group]|uniref:Peptidase M23 n=1 Tax=Bacillus thuringiensis serovar mexicanensis TaxID=180868 RepID=A0A242VWR3_BACTU|nr:MULTISPECIES: hypothetical protein [Bacillus cereus group]MDA1915600.1 hypothetical protein [Bacillus cereus group sp. BcHK140]MEB9673087.1 hypothetical protein [Bacillus anthracis]OTW43644.1 hypothetical protein BK699_35615 [Bacillus thuringiensis serovar mexicanensis]OTW95072.1 hypothetical protein BK705_34035 [Bacillus thuringiensis serovar monterrey]QKE10553.1 hypothetical protein HPG46_27255 [Bacillus cereus]
MIRLTQFSKLACATLIAGSGLSIFVPSHSVQADTLDHNYQDPVRFIPPSSARQTLEQKNTIVPESKVIKNHYVKYSKAHFQTKESIPKEIYYSSEGFKGYIQASTVWDMGDHFATLYSGTVIRC